MSITPNSAGAFLTINLRQIAENWKNCQHHGAIAGAVVKANAYGYGVKPIVNALYKAGCRIFFTAYEFEAAEIREFLTDKNVKIYALHGLLNGTEIDFLKSGTIPVLSTLDQIRRWNHQGDKENTILPAALHIDSGMSRLGLTPSDIDELVKNPPKYLNIELVISHLACASDPNNPKSLDQYEKFTAGCEKLKTVFPNFKKSLSATDGIMFNDPRFDQDVTRPGHLLYDKVATSLDVKILQIQTAYPGQTVGYGATYKVEKEMKIATLAIGYADGYPRSCSNKSFVYIGDYKCPVIGRISMDLTTIDVSHVDAETLKNTPTAEIFGTHQTADEAVIPGGTIDDELTTCFSSRFYRIYEGDEEV